MNHCELDGLPDSIALVHEWCSPKSVGGAANVVKSIDQFLCENNLHPDLVALVDGESKRRKSYLFNRKIITNKSRLLLSTPMICEMPRTTFKLMLVVIAKFVK